ncbi:MAG: endonuclease/exonuclease/phosphatase family metal-dependent hydrolase [Myxococcota bacterium]|jgi:endonuclease/exonuclease/phosphatase family metal-dependent hydrolase
MTLRVMTLNVRYDKPDPGDNAWAVRRSSLLHLIRGHLPDVLATQEALPHQLVELVVGLPEYAVVGRDRRGNGRGEYCAIFYRRERFECMRHGDFALSETPGAIGSVTPSWGNILPRIATWALLRDSETFKRVLVINTHFDHESARARHLSATLLKRKAQELMPDGGAVIIAGDFNSTAQDQCRVTLSDGLDDALARVEGDKVTYVDFEGAPRLSIDTVFFSRDLGLRRAEIDRAAPLEVRPSDHFAVLVDLEIF